MIMAQAGPAVKDFESGGPPSTIKNLFGTGGSERGHYNQLAYRSNNRTRPREKLATPPL